MYLQTIIGSNYVNWSVMMELAAPVGGYESPG